MRNSYPPLDFQRKFDYRILHYHPRIRADFSRLRNLKRRALLS